MPKKLHLQRENMDRIFISIYYYLQKNKRVAAIAALVFLFISGYFALKINFDEDISQILPKNDKADVTAKVISQLNFSDKIIVLIEARNSADQEVLYETADLFLEKTRPLKPYFKSIDGKVDDDQIAETFGFVQNHLPLFLEESDYKLITEKISPEKIKDAMQQNYQSLLSPSGLVTKNFIQKDPLGITMLGLQKLQKLNVSEDFRIENNYLISSNGKNLLLFIDPKFGGSETKNNEIFIENLEKIQTDINKKFAEKTELSYFGSTFIAVANAKQIKKDIQSTVLISSAILLLLLIFYFRNFLAPVIIFVPTIFGAAFGLLLMYFFRDKISAISLSVSAVLIGITIDYALHILTHYKHNANIEEVFKEITQPIMMSAITTAISFLCLVFVRSEALKDLGIFACITVLASALFTLIIIPQIYKPPVSEHKNLTVIDKIGAYPYEKNKALIILSSIVILASFFGWKHVRFNQNINDLNYVPQVMKTNEKKLEKLSDLTDKSIYTVSYGDTETEALQNSFEFSKFLQAEEKSGKILSYTSVSDLVLSEKEQQKKIKIWNEFWTPEKIKATLQSVEKNAAVLGFREDAFSELTQMLEKKYLPVPLSEYQKLKALRLSEFRNGEKGFYSYTTVVKIDEKNRSAFIKNAEKHPNLLAIDRQQLNENFLGLLKNDFNTLINYSLIAVITIFLLFFRNIDLTVMAVIPIVLSGIVTAGMLYFMGLELNIFSTIVCTLIFGAGVDFNIFLTQALQKELTTGENQLPRYRVSIILALLTTVLAIGSLIFAKHPALHSVASVALIGLLSVVIISFAMYPLMFNFIKKRQEKGISPITFRLFLHSAVSFIYYGLGGIIFSFIGQFIIPNAGKKTILLIKKIMGKFLTSVLYSNPFVKKRIINSHRENFSQPAVIIANHTSFLDTLAIAMVTPKIIFLVNDWVYYSPVFGKFVRALGFFPVSAGIENGMQQLKSKTEQGFSLMVFPESTRSMDNEVKRFHKGAFYLAQQFNLDILPFYIHGNSEVLPKDDYIIYDGSITVKVGERIPVTDSLFGKNYSEATKNINAFYRTEFQNLRNQLEDENYFKKILFLSFLYKDQEVVNSVKNDFKANSKLYFDLNKIIPKDATVLHIAEDYGQIDVLLTLQQASRKIYSYRAEAEKRKVAQNSYLVKRRKIIYVDTLETFSKKIDVLLLSTNNFSENLSKFNAAKIILIKDSYAKNYSLEDYKLVSSEKGVQQYAKH